MLATRPLLGRGPELQALQDLLTRVRVQGGALVVRGEAGIGKSALLAEAVRRATDRGMRVLMTAGVQSEADLPFAGLHQLLRPILGEVDALPGSQREAVLAAFGMAETHAPELFRTALAVLELLADCAARQPLLLVAEDAQWLDRPSREVLRFVARRLESDPIVLLAAVREGSESALDDAGLPELHLEGLDDAAAAELLDTQAPDLPPSVRERLLAAAAGNPLALVELPVAWAAEPLGDTTRPPDSLPLTTRLEEAFAARVAELPAATRTLLLVAAVDESGVLAEVLAAATLVAGADLTLEALAPAVSARLVEVEDVELRFRHPLVRSAIQQTASVSERHAAHAALAEVLADQPDRRVWHRAAATIGPDEDVASALEEAATRAEGRGAIAVAAGALERSTRLSADRARRAGRLLRAAELAFELGLRDLVFRLLREAETLEPGLRERTRIAWIRDSFDDGIPAHAASILSLAEAADRARADGETDLALNLLSGAALRCWWSDAGDEACERVLAAADRMPVAQDDPRLLAILAIAAPIGRGAMVLASLSRWAHAGPADPGATRLLGQAAFAVGDFELAAVFDADSVAGLRAQGRLALLSQVLVQQAATAMHLVRPHVAALAAEEGGRLARETAQPIWAAGAQVVEALLAGLRGEQELAEALAAEAERTFLRGRVGVVLTSVQIARGVTALGAGRHADAYAHLRRTFERGDPAYHKVGRYWAMGYLVDAAVRSGQRDAARSLIAELESQATRTPSPLLHMALRYARPLLADDDDAEPLFRAALDSDLGRWPFHRARLDLAYGAWLRRRRRVADSRAPLRAARAAFDALGALPWGERARQELRASGETSRRRTPEARDLLTPQELQIAELAADGLSNREIAERLYLSHRTVATHLYRSFPKLGISSRGELRGALSARSVVAVTDRSVT